MDYEKYEPKTTEIEIEGEKFVIRELVWSDYAKAKKLAGEDKELLTELLIKASIVKPALKNIDNLPLKVLNKIGNAMSEFNGLDVDKLKGF
jgi:hypothetical protein